VGEKLVKSMKYRSNTRSFELRVLEVGYWPVDEGKIGLFTQALP
jgi:hypothetical protein